MRHAGATRALVGKELRELRPWGILSLIIGLVDIVSHFASQIDQRPLAYTFGILSDAGSIVFWFMAFAIGTGITTREHDDRTLAFLDGLPVTRTRVFFVKCGVTVALVMLAPIVRFIGVVAMHLLSRGSLDHELHAALLLQTFGLQMLLVANGLLLGAALGQLRSLTWLIAGVLAAGLLLLMRNYPRTAVLDPLRLLDVELTSAGLRVDAETLRVQLAMGIVALAIAWFGFVRAGKSRLAALPKRPVIGAAISVLTTIAVLSVAGLYVSRQAEDFADAGQRRSPGSFEFSPSPPAQTVTTHYRFSYPAHQAQAALDLAGEADAIFERVHELLGAPPGDVIDVDLSGSMRNTHGTAYFGRVRMELASDARLVLAHETAHVVSQRMAGEQRDWLWQRAPTLNEGLSSWVDAHYEHDAAERDTEQLLLAAMHARRELLIEELATPERLAMLRDEDIKYPAGESLIAAAVRLYGEAAVPRLLRAFNAPGLPTDLDGLTLWQATFQVAGMDLGAVVDEFYREIAAYAQAHEQQIAALPRPRVRVVTSDGSYGVEALIDFPPDTDSEPLALTLRFKPEPDSDLRSLDTYPAAAFDPVWRDPEDIAGGQICVQAGIAAFGDKVLYEPWVCLPVRDAVAWVPDESVEAEISPEPEDLAEAEATGE